MMYARSTVRRSVQKALNVPMTATSATARVSIVCAELRQVGVRVGVGRGHACSFIAALTMAENLRYGRIGGGLHVIVATVSGVVDPLGEVERATAAQRRAFLLFG